MAHHDDVRFNSARRDAGVWLGAAVAFALLDAGGFVPTLLEPLNLDLGAAPSALDLGLAAPDPVLALLGDVEAPDTFFDHAELPVLDMAAADGFDHHFG